MPPRSSTSTGSSSSQTGSSAGKKRTFSSNRSKIELIQRSPNQTRGRTPCAFSSSGRVSVACSKSAMRVSRQSSLPKKNGELAATATCAPAIAWAAFQWFAKPSGSTCWWSWTLVQAASGAIVSAKVASRSTPVIEISRSSPRAAKICSFRRL